jgi:hypothetical protein
VKGRTSRRGKVSKGSGHTVNPNGGVEARRGLEKPTQVTTTRLRSGDLDEPPYADPLVEWCGGWGRKTPGYPISGRLSDELSTNKGHFQIGCS